MIYTSYIKEDLEVLCERLTKAIHLDQRDKIREDALCKMIYSEYKKHKHDYLVFQTISKATFRKKIQPFTDLILKEKNFNNEYLNINSTISFLRNQGVFHLDNN